MPIRLRALVLLALATAACDVPRDPAAPAARRDVLDLSHWNFEVSGPVALRGEWTFRYGELAGPSALPRDETPPPPMIVVPRPWNDAATAGATAAAERLPAHIADVPIEAGTGVSLQLTVTFEDLLRRADRALPAGKTAGGNLVRVAQRDDVETTAVQTRG